MSEIYFLRHGEIDANVRNIWAGQTNFKLNSNGIDQIERIRAEILSLQINRVYSSPLSRAIETANIICSSSASLSTTIIPCLSERNYGAFEGREKTLENRNNLERDPSVENIISFVSRVKKSMACIEINERSLIISHSGVFKVLLNHLGFTANPAIRQIKNGQLIKLKTPS